MFVIVSTYMAKAGEEDAIIALHEDWQRHQQFRTRRYLSGELLRNESDPREFLAMLRFENPESAQALLENPERKAWEQRLASFTEHPPTRTGYTSEWSQTPER